MLKSNSSFHFYTLPPLPCPPCPLKRAVHVTSQQHYHYHHQSHASQSLVSHCIQDWNLLYMDDVMHEETEHSILSSILPCGTTKQSLTLSFFGIETRQSHMCHSMHPSCISMFLEESSLNLTSRLLVIQGKHPRTLAYAKARRSKGEMKFCNKMQSWDSFVAINF